MTQFHLQNSSISLSVNNFGAEINRLLFKNEEIIYQKQENFWQRQSPVLFPIVGGLKNGEYEWQGKRYQLPQHGFARDREFECVFQNETELHFLLKSDEKTLENYPFDFELYIRYFLEENALKVEYEVKNVGNSEMYYSIGLHPAFQIRTDIERYLLDFNENMENEKIFRLNETHLLDEAKTENFPILTEKNILQLDEKLFENDAIIFRDLKAKKIDFYREKIKLFTFEFENFSHFGIWKQKNSPFICLEPWAGYADIATTNGKLSEKSGIQKLSANASEKYSWKINFEGSHIVAKKFVMGYLLLGFLSWIAAIYISWQYFLPHDFLSWILFALGAFLGSTAIHIIGIIFLFSFMKK